MSDEDDGMRKELIEKIKSLPKPEILSLIRLIFKNKSNDLAVAIKVTLGKRASKPDKFIQGQKLENLLKIISFVKDLPAQEINFLFEEYFYGKNSTLYFFMLKSLIASSLFDKSLEEQEQFVKKKLQELSDSWTAQGLLPDFQSFKTTAVRLEKGILEIIIEYESKYNYRHTETRQLAHIYQLEEAIIWISKEKNVAIVKVKYAPLVESFRNLLASITDSEIIRFQLTKSIVNEIFGFDSIINAHYIEPQADDRYVEKKTYSDKNFKNKEESRLTDQRCERPSSFHSLPVGEESHVGVAINERGRLSIYKQMKKTDLRDFAIEKVKKIMDLMAEMKFKNLQDFFKGIDFNSVQSLQEIHSDNNKRTMISVIKHVASISLNNQRDAILEINTKDLLRNLGDYFNPVFLPICSGCGGTSFICKKCQTLNSYVVSENLSVHCQKCQQELTNVDETLQCVQDPTHKVDGGISDNLVVLANKKFRNLANKISDELEIGFALSDFHTTIIKGNTLSCWSQTYKYLYLFDEMPSFKKIPPTGQFKPDVINAQLKGLTKLGERCTNFKDNADCSNCVLQQVGLCLQRLIANFVTEPKLHAHSGYEFGDISFKENIDGEMYTIVGLGKSIYNKNFKHSLTLKNEDGMKLLSQFVDALMDSRIRFISIISSAIVDDKLKETMIELAKWKVKKILFIERDHIVRVLSQYLTLLSEPISLKNFHEGA